MNRSQFVYVSYIATTPQRLWDALTRGEFTQKYWFGRRIESDWQSGSPVRFFDGDSDVLTDDGVVLENDPPRRLSYTFHQVGDNMPTTRVTFIIDTRDGLVKLTLIHDEMPNEEMAEAFREGWAPILSSLKTYLESGKPLPLRMGTKAPEKGR